MKRFQRPPPRPFPTQSRLESASVLFERVTQASDAQYAAQVARDSLPPPTPRSWHHYHPQASSPIAMSPGASASGANTPSRYASFSSINEIATSPHPFGYTPSPYPAAAAQPTPTQRLAHIFPFSSAGSTSTIYKTIIKRPALVQLYLTEDELHTNAPDVEAQFLAELRAYRTTGPHVNIAAFLGCLDGVGMILEFVEGDTFFERVVKKRTGGPVVFSPDVPAVTPRLKVEWFNQLVDALVHVHRHGLSHGDINTLNVMITYPSAHPPNSVKLIDFGRSTFYNPLPPTNAPPTVGPISSFHARHPNLGSAGLPSFVNTMPPSEVPQPSAHPFAAPETLRGGRYIDPITKKRLPVDGRLTDAYSLGVLLWCLDEERLLDLDRDAQKREDVVLFNISDDEDSDSDSANMGDDGYGGDESSSSSASSSPNGSLLVGPLKKLVFDEGYFSAETAVESASEDLNEIKKAAIMGFSMQRPLDNELMKHPRLFSKLIKGYMKKWEERTKISLDQKIPLATIEERDDVVMA